MNMHKPEKLTEWNILDDLDDDEKMTLYLEAAAEDPDPNFIIMALNDVARAKGINKLAREMGVSRESLYKSFNGETKPRFETVHKALRSLGFQLTIKHLEAVK